MSPAPTSAWNWCLGVEILLVARDLVVQKALGSQPCLCPTSLSISVPHPHPNVNHQHREPQSGFHFAWGSDSVFRPGGRGKLGSKGEASSPEGRKPLVVSWFRLIESLQLELFHL